MEDVIVYGLSAIFGGILGWLFASAIEKYFNKAKSWFESVWDSISRQVRAIGILVRKGNRLFKKFWVEFTTGQEEIYEPSDDNGVEVDRKDLTDEVNQALDRQGYVAIWSKTK